MRIEYNHDGDDGDNRDDCIDNGEEVMMRKLPRTCISLPFPDTVFPKPG